MTLFKWDDAMSVGVKAMDDDHKKMMSLINRLYEAVKKNKESNVLESTFTELFAYIDRHIENEERLLKNAGFPKLPAHKKEHRACIKELRTIYAQYMADKERMLSLDLLAMLCSWWKKHVLVSDMKYKEHLSKLRTSSK